MTAQKHGDLQAALFDDDTEYNSKVAGLNVSQREAFDQIVRWTREHHQYFMGESNSLPEPLYLLITGGAGTSKSHLISVINPLVAKFSDALYSGTEKRLY